MDKKFDAISPEQMQQLASSPTAKALMRMLQNGNAVDLDHAVESAKMGDMAQLHTTLQSLMADPRAQALLKKLQEEQHG